MTSDNSLNQLEGDATPPLCQNCMKPLQLISEARGWQCRECSGWFVHCPVCHRPVQYDDPYCEHLLASTGVSSGEEWIKRPFDDRQLPVLPEGRRLEDWTLGQQREAFDYLFPVTFAYSDDDADIGSPWDEQRLIDIVILAITQPVIAFGTLADSPGEFDESHYFTVDQERVRAEITKVIDQIDTAFAVLAKTATAS